MLNDWKMAVVEKNSAARTQDLVSRRWMPFAGEGSSAEGRVQSLGRLESTEP
ncbi:MAG: hypothetical protein SPL23_14550 [Lachnospiraceae bacterium]|nr:hypothetical protein [Lachnospiraceae bacterium]